LPRFAGGCGGCRNALGRRHARCSVAHSELCGETGGPSSADDGRGLSLRACFCQVQIKKRCPILLKTLFRTAHSQISLATRVTRVEVTVGRGKVSARRRPKSIPGRLPSRPRTTGSSGSPASPSGGDQSQTVKCVRAVTEAIAFAQLVERVERSVTVLVDEAVERAADARAAATTASPPPRCCLRRLWATPAPLRGVAGVVHVVRDCSTPKRHRWCRRRPERSRACSFSPFS